MSTASIETVRRPPEVSVARLVGGLRELPADVIARTQEKYLAALKNLLDHFLEEYFWRPSAIVSYSAGRFVKSEFDKWGEAIRAGGALPK